MARKPRTVADKLRQEMDYILGKHQSELKTMEQALQGERTQREDYMYESRMIRAEYVGYQKGVKEILRYVYRFPLDETRPAMSASVQGSFNSGGHAHVFQKS